MSFVVRIPLVASVLLCTVAHAAEYPIGAPQQRHGLEIAGVYLQPVEMESVMGHTMLPATQADVHLEADIRALASNPNGFAEGEWVPYLLVRYEVCKQGGDCIRGDFLPMVASDGPHYGDNVKLMGPGKYSVKFEVAPPAANPMAHFGRHTDRLTGVRPWFKPFTVEYEFVYAGIGKKGGY